MAVRVAATIEPMNGQTYPVVSASNVSGLAAVATTGDYNDLINTPGGGGGTNSEYAQKIGTSSSHPAIGSKKLPVYVNSWGNIRQTESLEFDNNDCYLKPRTGGDKTHTNIIEPTWADHNTAYTVYGYDTWLYTVAFLQSFLNDAFRMTINNTEYHLSSAITSTNIQTFCPNAQSASVDSGYQLLDSSDNVLSGVGLVNIFDTYYLLIADYVLFTGTTYPTAFEGAYYIFTTSSDIVKSTLKANIVSVQDIKDLETITSKNDRITLTADSSSIRKRKYKTSLTNSGNGYYETITSMAFDTPVTITIGGVEYTGTWYKLTDEYPGYENITGAYNNYGYCFYCYFMDKAVIILDGYSTTSGHLLIDESIYETITTSDSLDSTRFTTDGNLIFKGHVTLTGLDSQNESDRGKLTVNRINCHGTEIYQGSDYKRSTFYSLTSSGDWRSSQGCWECGYPVAVVQEANWSPDNKAEFEIFGLTSLYGTSSYYADRSQIASVDLQTYCPNANSLTVDAFPVYYWNENTNAYVNTPGMCMSKNTNGSDSYVLWVDATIYSGTNNIPDFIISDSAYVTFYYTINNDVGYLNTNELYATNIGFSENISSPKLSTYTYGTKSGLAPFGQYKSWLSYYNTWYTYRSANLTTTYGFEQWQPYAIEIDGQTYNGTWYEGGTGPGYYDTGYQKNSYDYCYFTSGCCIVCTSSSAMRLLANSEIYSMIRDSDVFLYTTQVPTNDGITEVNGMLRVTGTDSYERGMIYCNAIAKNDYSSDPIMPISAAITLPLWTGSEDLVPYWVANSSGMYTCEHELDISPFDYVSVSWESTDISYTSVTINPNDWWIDSSNNAFGFNVFNNSGADAQPISVWYNTSTRMFQMWEDAQTGNAIPTTMYVTYCKPNGVDARSVIQTTNAGYTSTQRQTISTPGCIAMTDSQSGLVIKPDKIQIGNPGDSTGTTVTLSRNSITIGSTTINEAQLQALLAMITNPPAPATLGIMSIVE